MYRPLTVEEHHPMGYVHDDIAWARKHGYGSRIQAKADKARLDNPNVAYRKSLPEQRRRDYDTALGGGAEAREVSAEVPAGGTYRKRVGGCVGKAEEQLYGDPEAWFAADKTATGLQAHAMEAVLDDSRFTAAVERWSQCIVHATCRALLRGPRQSPGSGAAADPTAAGDEGVRDRAGDRRDGCHLRPRHLVAQGRRETRGPPSRTGRPS
ncbi:hypothetical protein [Streptomyces sp. NPDC057336]|uniref:hypothetical protein n=1 Tax=Streptomyces sp. NPDC057336 TaxID=3346102 RepID=UPI00364500EA